MARRVADFDGVPSRAPALFAGMPLPSRFDGIVVEAKRLRGARQQVSDRTFGMLDPIAASELLRGPSLIAETRLR